MKISIENIDSFYNDAKPLFEKDWEETTDDNIKFTIDETEYRNLEKVGRLLIITARENAILAGYICFITHDSMHHRGTTAVCSGLYVDKPYRGMTGYLLLENAKLILEKVGVQKMKVSTSTKNDVGRLFERIGLKPKEIIYEMMLNLNENNKNI